MKVIFVSVNPEAHPDCAMEGIEKIIDVEHRVILTYDSIRDNEGNEIGYFDEVWRIKGDKTGFSDIHIIP